MLKLNVGLSKKVGEDNSGSRGASVHVEIELDTSLASQPDRMRERIRELFGVARCAVDEDSAPPPVRPATSPPRTGSTRTATATRTATTTMRTAAMGTCGPLPARRRGRSTRSPAARGGTFPPC
jgi:hypothetical protein